jgi:hypothetical protein
MYIVAVAWIYVVLMMSIAEQSLIAGIMTFLLYGVLPLSIILYLLATPERKRRRVTIKKAHPTSVSEQPGAMPAPEQAPAAGDSH